LIILGLALLALLAACGEQATQPPATATPTPPVASMPTTQPAPTGTPTVPPPATEVPAPPVPSDTPAPPTATPVPPTPVPPTATPGVTRYTVQPGDNLTGIAARYGVNVDRLAQVNGITDSNMLFAGQVLVIPDGSAPLPPTPTATPGPVDGTLVHYTVQPGDGVFAIARRYNTTVDAIVARNNLDNPNYVMSGQVLEIVVGDKTSKPAPRPTATPVPTLPPAPPPGSPSEGKWIDVNLSTQTLVAYAGDTPVFTTLVSTGVPAYPTVVGTFKIQTKLRYDDMRGGSGADAYYLPDVPYVMYFYTGGYALHGTYWHHNFGQPMSHGCVNLPTDAAAWVYNWAPIGTTIQIHW
jgi:LysM repeat protein